MVFMKASCCLRIASKPGIVAMGFGKFVRFSSIFDWPSRSISNDADPELFERLRALRKRIATEATVPPYVVFSDAALRAMCLARPKDEAQFLDVQGVGQKKLERYGEEFLREINA